MLLKKIIIISLALMSLAYSHVIGAIGLGDIKVYSGLNEPFNAEITIIEAGGLEENLILANLASTAEFNRAGLERFLFLTKFNFNVVSFNNEMVVHISSIEPIKYPTIEFLVELLWPEGRLVKTYGVILELENGTKKKEKVFTLLERKMQAVQSGTMSKFSDPGKNPLNSKNNFNDDDVLQKTIEEVQEGLAVANQEKNNVFQYQQTQPATSLTPQLPIQEQLINKQEDMQSLMQQLNTIPQPSQRQAQTSMQEIDNIDKQQIIPNGKANNELGFIEEDLQEEQKNNNDAHKIAFNFTKGLINLLKKKDINNVGQNSPITAGNVVVNNVSPLAHTSNLKMISKIFFSFLLVGVAGVISMRIFKEQDDALAADNAYSNGLTDNNAFNNSAEQVTRKTMLQETISRLEKTVEKNINHIINADINHVELLQNINIPENSVYKTQQHASIDTHHVLEKDSSGSFVNADDNFLQDCTPTELKLQLAQQYIAINDFDSARTLLVELIDDNIDKKVVATAKQILEAIDG